MMKSMKEERELILNEVKDSEYKILRAMEMSERTNTSEIDQRDDDDTQIHLNQSINATSSDTIQLEILKLLREMRDDNNESKKRNKRSSGKENNGNKNNGRNSRSNNNGN